MRKQYFICAIISLALLYACAGQKGMNDIQLAEEGHAKISAYPVANTPQLDDSVIGNDVHDNSQSSTGTTKRFLLGYLPISYPTQLALAEKQNASDAVARTGVSTLSSKTFSSADPIEIQSSSSTDSSPLWIDTPNLPDSGYTYGFIGKNYTAGNNFRFGYEHASDGSISNLGTLGIAGDPSITIDTHGFIGFNNATDIQIGFLPGGELTFKDPVNGTKTLSDLVGGGSGSSGSTGSFNLANHAYAYIDQLTFPAGEEIRFIGPVYIKNPSGSTLVYQYNGDTTNTDNDDYPIMGIPTSTCAAGSPCTIWLGGERMLVRRDEAAPLQSDIGKPLYTIGCAGCIGTSPQVQSGDHSEIVGEFVGADGIDGVTGDYILYRVPNYMNVIP